MPSRIDPSGVVGPTRGQAYGPRWRRTGKGLFVPATADRDRVEQRILEEFTRLPPRSIVSGWAALRLHGANFFDGLDHHRRVLPVPVVVPPGANIHLEGVERHREDLRAGEVCNRYGICCATPARALFDAMKWAGHLRSAVRAADMAMAAQVVGLEEMRCYAATRLGDRGSRLVRDALGHAEPRTKSPRESDMRMVWVFDAGLPRPRCNWPVADEDARRIGRPDLLSEETAVVGEYDGAEHRSRARQARDVETESAYRDAGLECFRVVGEMRDVRVVVSRMHAAVRRAREADSPRRWMIRRDPGPL